MLPTEYSVGPSFGCRQIACTLLHLRLYECCCLKSLTPDAVSTALAAPVSLLLCHPLPTLQQAELYEHSQILGNLIGKGPVPGVETYCIYGACRAESTDANLCTSAPHQATPGWCSMPKRHCMVYLAHGLVILAMQQQQQAHCNNKHKKSTSACQAATARPLTR